MTHIILKNCSVFDGSKQLKTNLWIEVEGNMIKAVSPSEIVRAGASIIDVKGKTVLPGLIDCHVHVTAADIDLANDDIPESEVAIQAARFMEDMLMRGFTSIRDAGGADQGLANAVKKGLIKGPRLYYSGKALSQTGGHGDFRAANIGGDLCSCACSGSTISVVVDGVDEVRKAVREQLRKGATQIKIMASGGVASPTDKVSNTQYSDDEMRAIVEEARAHGTYVMAHAYGPEAIAKCIKAGVRTIEHGSLLTEAMASLMAEHGVYLVPTLVVYESLVNLGPKLNFPAASLAKVADVRTKGLESIKLARAKGVKVGFGTDLLGVEAQTWQAKEFVIRAEKEAPYEIIHSATAVNAEILHEDNKLGVIAPGAYADLLVVNGDPLRDIALLAGQGEALDLIMKDGVVFKNRLS